MWKEGTIAISDGAGQYKFCRYWAKCFEEPSEYGIKGGRISKLQIRIDDRVICNYDRGWDIEPTCEEAEIAFAILTKEFN